MQRALGGGAASPETKQFGEQYLAENKRKEGVVTLASGLQYKVIKAGKGTSPKATDQVKTHYEGRLINGKVFDSSYKRGEPATFPVNGVIKGWTEALQLMKPGSQWELYVPAELGYGARGAGANIGPNSTLIFKVEARLTYIRTLVIKYLSTYFTHSITIPNFL